MSYLQYQKSILTGLSVLGFYLVWGVMYRNGSFDLMLRAAWTATYEDGRYLSKSYTGIFAVDFPVQILVVFFDGLLGTSDPAPYLMLVELVATLLVINVMTLVEGSRVRAVKELRFPALWQYGWNCAGVAVFLPIWVLLYLGQGSAGNSELPLNVSTALPTTTLWLMASTTPLLLPALCGATPGQIHIGVICFFLTPPLYAIALRIGRFVVARGFSVRNPVEVSYKLAGVVSAVVHLLVLYRIFGGDENQGLSLGRVYVPDPSAVQSPAMLTEGALLFIQYDYVVTGVVIILLGMQLLSVEAKTSGWMSEIGVFVLLFVVAGPGAGLAYALFCKERRLGEGMIGKSKRV
ncbi:hypothetical protein QBC34DRAFT_26593 [Podospora aff. communis PSN243]|uniref:Uncharacterized protein n=1 Tax=Podospora aff. communis PSN243 TaxID=3040156 RepID=A0AAV9GUC5_9PEZI|nr:hypothetical protein QBC34DRAFT_26593 [Podospora aff. communis PSN243]